MRSSRTHWAKVCENPRLIVAKDAYEACAGAHAIAIVTEWDEFKTLDYAKIYAGIAQAGVLFDGRNIVDLGYSAKIGFSAVGIGQAGLIRRAVRPAKLRRPVAERSFAVNSRISKGFLMTWTTPDSWAPPCASECR